MFAPSRTAAGAALGSDSWRQFNLLKADHLKKSANINISERSHILMARSAVTVGRASRVTNREIRLFITRASVCQILETMSLKSKSPPSSIDLSHPSLSFLLSLLILLTPPYCPFPLLPLHSHLTSLRILTPCTSMTYIIVKIKRGKYKWQ